MALPGTISQTPTFNPAVAIITAITQAQNAVVTTSFPHTFIVGQSVRIVLPTSFIVINGIQTSQSNNYGMPHINNMLANIIEVPPQPTTFFTTDIDSRFFQPFVVPANPTQFAQAVPVGENPFQINGPMVNVLLPYNTIPNSLLVNNPFQQNNP